MGEKLQTLRKSRGWSQEQLAAEVHVSRQALSKWELGTAVPDTENVLQLADIFDVSTDFLLKDDWETDKWKAVPSSAAPAPVRKQVYPSVVMGSTLSVLSVIGILVLGILSSVHPVYISSASAVAGTGGEEIEMIVETGLMAYLSVHNLQWLFVLCLAGAVIGIILALLPWWMPLLRRGWRWFDGSA